MWGALGFCVSWGHGLCAPLPVQSPSPRSRGVSCRLITALFVLQGPCWGVTSTVRTEPAPAPLVSAVAVRGGGDLPARGTQGPRRTSVTGEEGPQGLTWGQV